MKRSTKRFVTAVPYHEMPRGPNGRRLCRWCQTEVPKGRRTFCSQPCIDEWTLRSNPGAMRAFIEKRDKGICAICGLDAVRLQRILKKLLRRATLGSYYGNGVDVNVRKSIQFRYIRAEKRLGKAHLLFPWAFDRSWQKLGKLFPHSRSLWEADHIVPVVEGGGQCGPENMRTLCLECHRDETAKLRRRLYRKRKKSKLIKRLPVVCGN